MRKDNQDEIRVKQYLQTLTYTHLEFEPLGNVTPDFVIDNRIAVEARRLNRNYLKDEHLVQIESCQITLDDTQKDNPPYIIEDLHKNIQLVIDEKNNKINNHFPYYDEWWLILVDYITYGMSQKDFEELNKLPLKKQKFSKILILSPKGDFKVFKL